MLIKLTSTSGAAVLVNPLHIVRAAPSVAVPGANELWLSSNEILAVREDVAAIQKKAEVARE